MDEQYNFLIEVLQATANSKGNPEVVYPLLEANLDKLDDNFVHILQTWATVKFSEVESDTTEFIANTIGNFSNRLREFPLGNKANNMEIVIAGYEVILKVFTRKSNWENWATIQNNLGTAYSDRIRGDRAKNLENAIAAFNLALEVYTKEDFPVDWAMTQNNLGLAYSDRIKYDRAQNLENAIAAHKQALKVYTKEDFPVDWARTQNNLGIAYKDRIRGDRAENLKNAIDAFEQALEIRTRKDFPIYWATTQNNLGIAYRNRINGDRAENLKKAIAAHKQALKVYTKKDFPIYWAGTQNNLGIAYKNRISGDRAENLKNAIAAYKRALEVYTKKDFPIQWATTQNNLGIAYHERISGNKEENLEKAIAAFSKALEVRTKKDFPIEWARTQHNLGLAYTETICDKKTENLEKAIAAFEQALEIRTLEANPIDHLQTTRNLGKLYFKQGNWQPAIAAYEKAITAVELSRSWSKDDDRRQEILEDAIVVYQNIVQCFVNLQQYEKAVEYAERSRSRMVTELMASKDLCPNAEIPAQLLEEYYRLQQRLSDLRRSTSEDSSKQLATAKSRFDRRDSGEVEKQRLAEIEQVEKERQQVWREIRKSDPILAGQLQVDPLSIEQMQALIKDKETAILSFYTTDDDTHIFILHQQDIQLFTCKGQGIETLQNWIGKNWLKPYVYYRNQENREWFNNMGEFLQQLADRLQLNQVIAEYLRGIKELIIVPHLYLHQIPFAALPVDVSPTTGVIPPTPLGKGGYENPASLGKGGDLDPVSPFLRGTEGGSTVGEEIPPTPLNKGGSSDSVSPFFRGTEGGSTVGEEIPPTPLNKGGYEGPVSPFLRGTEGGSNRGFADTRLSIPTGNKTTPPPTKKAKTAENKPTYLSDIFRLRVIPSCQILSYCDNRNKSTDSLKMGIVENATGDLMFTGYECQNLAEMFQVPNNLRLKYQQATVNNYRQLAKQVQFLHSSHHASADLMNPLESKLQLFDGEVTLGDVFTWRLPELTDVFLSCCETNLTVSKVSDEILTIAAGFLSAGAQSVVSTLWAVDDFATALFCLFYYEYRQNPKYTRPQALHAAQVRLRSLTGEQLNGKYRQQLEAHLRDIETEENKNRVGEMKFNLALLCEQEYPFINPYYWAGFVSGGLQ